MKKIYLLLVCLMASGCVFGQNKQLTAEQAVQQLVKDAFEEVWSKLDTEKVKVYHTDDFLLLEHGVVWTNDSVMAYQKKELARNPALKRHNKFDFFKVEKQDNLVWVAYHNYATWTLEDKPVGKAHWLESAVAIKTAGGWKLQMLHSTRVEH